MWRAKALRSIRCDSGGALPASHAATRGEEVELISIAVDRKWGPGAARC